MTNSFDYCAFTGDLWHLGQQPRRHSWPEAEATLKPSTSGIFEPLPDQEEIALRSSMTSRASNHSGSCILAPKFKYNSFKLVTASSFLWTFESKATRGQESC